MQTKREYLVTLGLAKMGRGKFSREGIAAIEKATAQGMEFSDMAKAVKVSTVRNDSQSGESSRISRASVTIPADSFDPKAVRSWAQAQGIPVAAKGRIHSDVVSQYLAATPDAPKRGAANPSQDIRQEAARVRFAEVYSVVYAGEKIVKTYKDCCNQCGYSIGWCYCPNGPIAYTNDFQKVTLTAGK